MSNDTSHRAQAYTLEGVFAAIIVLTSLVFGLQIVDIGPWASDTSEQTSALETRAEDVLTLTANDGNLSKIVRCYQVGARSFQGSTLDDDATQFERLLNQSLSNQSVSFNVYFRYQTENGEVASEAVSQETGDPQSLIAPSDTAVVASRTVAVYDDEPVRIGGASGTACGDTFSNAPRTVKQWSEQRPYFMSDVAPNSSLFNVVEVRIVAW
jgi:hypothetical protein